MPLARSIGRRCGGLLASCHGSIGVRQAHRVAFFYYRFTYVVLRGAFRGEYGIIALAMRAPFLRMPAKKKRAPRSGAESGGQEAARRNMRRLAAIGVLSVLMMAGFGTTAGMAQSRADVYLLRGLTNIFSLGMDTLAEKIQHRGINATVHNYSEWQSLADHAAAAYHAGTEGPIIIIGHSLGADAVMQMSAYLGKKGVPVALAVPFDGTQSFATPSNVSRVLNLTHADYGRVYRGNGFHGSLSNIDVSNDRSIDHLNIDKSARLHAQVLGAILAVVGSGGGGNAKSGPAAHDRNAPRS